MSWGNEYSNYYYMIPTFVIFLSFFFYKKNTRKTKEIIITNFLYLLYLTRMSDDDTILLIIPVLFIAIYEFYLLDKKKFNHKMNILIFIEMFLISSPYWNLTNPFMASAGRIFGVYVIGKNIKLTLIICLSVYLMILDLNISSAILTIWFGHLLLADDIIKNFHQLEYGYYLIKPLIIISCVVLLIREIIFIQSLIKKKNKSSFTIS